LKIVYSFIISFLGYDYVVAQVAPIEYFNLISRADSLYNNNDYKSCANSYWLAFKVYNEGYKRPGDVYQAACSSALANLPDSSFSLLNRVASQLKYKDYEFIISDPDLVSLHNDKRWNPLIKIIFDNKNQADATLNRALVNQLDSIYKEDQDGRYKTDEIENKYGRNSKELSEQLKILHNRDSINLLLVENILKNNGWPAQNTIGDQGEQTIFLVIQHADLSTQRKYLHLLENAVKDGKENKGRLALLLDRIAMREDNLQTYGTQVITDTRSGISYVWPLKDPDNVDVRRSEMGLDPIAVYVKKWNIPWNVQKYKEDLPKLKALIKSAPR
jgi:hypothetical protein